MPKLPIILAHGYLGFGQLGPFSYFNNVAQILQRLGVQNVYATAVPPKGSLKDRSELLAQQIRAHVSNGKVNVIAHSMGGLDARYLIAKGNGRDMIETLTTLGSPFGGTLAADIAADPRNLSQIDPKRLISSIVDFTAATALRWPFSAGDTHFAIQQLRDAVSKLPGDYSELGSYFSGLFTIKDAALQELTTSNCKRIFPADCSDLAGVECYSYAGVLPPADVNPILTVPGLVLDAAGLQNDGVVPLDSAKLPRHMGTLGADHLGLIGWSSKDVSGCYRDICQTLASH